MTFKLILAVVKLTHVKQVNYVFEPAAFDLLSETVETYDNIAAKHELKDSFIR